MTKTLGALTIVFMMAAVIVRVWMLRKEGITAMKFGKLDKTDFLIPPFVLFYYYTIFASPLHWPLISRQVFFHSALAAWLGVLACLNGLALLVWGIACFGRSFRVGIDEDRPGKLVTMGAFAFSRNPLYVAFALILTGQFLIFPNWVLLVYLAAALWLFQRQVLREEDSLKKHYGEAYAAYCARVRRYF